MAVKGGAEQVVAGANAESTTAQKSTARKPAAKKAAAAKKPAAKKATTPRKSTAGTARRGTSVTTLPVLEQEDPWTTEELAEVEAELQTDRDRLQTEVDEAEADLAELMREGGEGSGDDQADAGSATWEREHELSLTNNARELLQQIERALERIEEGVYGTCESCGNPIGKMRLQAFPRATLCLTCKQKQERR
ncbi:TraR/DksA family transcriptional regulator [Ornithinimicrobium cryptoxanthini]|uniref:TraR/DksA C4-type zinc finger protein n=1 Tax=Ornithinimicrobium cryptoxanthini TaxID=2934161 RepID=A0ABY4YL12_9MICO|nr:TraR/DksA C4-type zinc finger protein [Ornithinimicrobium cryptoxanthini]USQ77485.1 TraR/DksA C4-type zinc finger protein [Ornithinimicrobium cryptoxanthini]